MQIDLHESDEPMPSDPEIRDHRQQAIVALLRETPVSSQGEVVARLKERGIPATQSSVSRDLRDLGVWRKGRHYVLPDQEEDVEEAEWAGLDEVALFLRGAQPAGANLTVVHTVVGAAQTVAVAIDNAAWPEVVGTMAGDDTIFLATADADGQSLVLRRLQRLLQER
jgi:transcriptional regulator of arginine metabolism